MRDLLPIEARREALLGQRLVEAFELHGYQRVGLPVFEYAEVLERGLGALSAGEVLKFVEPESGEVVALRPDMTPQVARLIATRLAASPLPARLCYLGSVVRRRQERARRRRQIPQAGFELIGRHGAAGDLEVLEVATAAVASAGLGDFAIDLSHARIASTLLEHAPRAAWPELLEALELKDESALARRAEAAGVGAAMASKIAQLASLHGGAEVWPAARRVLGGTAAEGFVGELEALWQGARDLAPRLLVDLGETRHFDYYSGPIFHILAEGPGEPVGSGGRYDGLLAEFGFAQPAAGFAVDIDNLDWALRRGGAVSPHPRILVAAGLRAASEILSALRAVAVPCALAPEGDPRAYGRAWDFSHVLEAESGRVALRRLADDGMVSLCNAEPAAVVQTVTAALGSARSR
jgi:ATP phosphoribosyltransferase regulatory subunit